MLIPDNLHTKILITGSGSFIGTGFRAHTIHDNVSELSLLEGLPDSSAFRGFDVVLHLAAIVHQSRKIPLSEYIRINHDLCLGVAKNAKDAGVKQFIFLSTVKVYGSSKGNPGPWSELSTCLPDDPYGKSKLMAERSLRDIEDKEFVVSIIRTPLVYGPCVKANMLSLMRMIRYCPVLPLGRINNLRHYTYIGNLCHLIDLVIERKASGTFIALDKDPVSTTTLVKFIADAIGKRVMLLKLPKVFESAVKAIFPLKHERIFSSMLLDNSHTRNVLDYNPPYTSETGIREMVSVFLAGTS